jgi:hypothetical protein
LDRRFASLAHLLALEKPTSLSVPYDAYPDGPPSIVWESDEMRQRYEHQLSNTTMASCNE